MWSGHADPVELTKPNARLGAVLARWERVAVGVALALAVLAWVGWSFEVPALTRILPSWPQMTPWTALLVAGLAISILLQSGQPSSSRVRSGSGAAVLVGVLAVVFLAEYLTHRSWGLDGMWFRGQVGGLQATWPGRPSPQSAAAVLLLAGAVAVMHTGRRWACAVWVFGLALAALVSCVAIGAYLFEVVVLVGVTPSTGMGMSTALSVLLLVVAAVLARPDRRPIAWVLARPDGWTLVRLVGIVAGLPLLMGLSRGLLVTAGLDENVALLTAVMVSTVVMGVATVHLSQREQKVLAQRAAVEARFRLLAENSIDIVVHLRGVEPVWVSPSIEPAFGWPVQHWIGADFVPRIHPDDVEKVLAALAENAQGKPAAARFRTATADGGYRWVEGHGKPYIDGEGNADGVIAAFRIIDAQIALERELEQARDSAIALTEAKSDYVVTVSHEIRAPLNAILGFSELLDNQLSSEGRNLAAEWSRLVRTEAERLTRLIEDLLSLSRLEASKAKIACKAFALRRMVEDVIQVSRFKAEAKGLRLNASLDPNISDWRTGDPDKVHQVLMNLVSNATKFTREGRVDVEISSAATETAADLIRFAVSDTGPGIPGEEVQRILEPFAQVSAADADRGSGLGLAISDRIVKALGGDGLAVVSLEGHGTTFHFTIPLPESAPQEPSSWRGTDEPAESGSTGTILVVDDNPTNQLLVEAQLKRLGYSCEVASDGAQALERLDAGRFAAVLMDCNMPVMDGYEATRRIRARERGTGVHIPILALTASALDANRDACDRAGMDGFLTKPLLLSTLAQELSRFVDPGETDSCYPAAESSCSGQDMSNAAILDDARIDRLLAELGAGPLQKVALAFVNEMPRRLAELRRAAGECDADAVRRGAHALRSPSAMLGASALAERLRVVEESADPVPRLSEAPLDDLIDATMERLHARIGQSVDQGGAI